ncbi:MAG: AMP-binding protein [Actinomycetota bacterium]
MFFETTLTQARIDASEAQWPNDHLIDRFLARLPERTDQPLVVDAVGTISWGEVAESVDAASKALVGLGVRRSDVVQLQLPNRREFLIMVLAVERVGAVVQPVAPIFRHNEVAVMNELAKPKVVITVDEFRGFALAAMHADIGEAAPWLEQIVVVEGTGGAARATARCLPWDDFLDHGRASALDDVGIELLRPSVHDVCEIIFTSGTTGQPKGVMHNQNTLNVATDLWRERVAADATVFHMASTLAHQTGYLYGVRAPICAGGTVVYQQIWDPVEFVDLVDTHRIQVSMGATPFLADVLAVDGVSERDLSSFEAFVCAGAAIPLPVLERARALLPCTVMPGWGMTETALSTTSFRDSAFEKLSTDGVPLAGNAVRVVDEDGTPCGPGVEGDLQFSGSLLFIGYIQGRELTESCFDGEWFDTGDRATMDADGFISISGRTKDIVIRGGENVPVKEVEDVLLRHPSVANVAIVAKPHERLGEIGCAVILAEGDAPSLIDLTDFLAEQQVTKQFWPEDLVVVDEFPMTPSGKIQKYQLRALID